MSYAGLGRSSPVQLKSSALASLFLPFDFQIEDREGVSYAVFEEDGETGQFSAVLDPEDFAVVVEVESEVLTGHVFIRHDDLPIKNLSDGESIKRAAESYIKTVFAEVAESDVRCLSYTFPSSGTDVYLKSYLAPYMVAGEIAVLIEVGDDKRHYLHGLAEAINHKGEVVSVCVDDIYEKAGLAFNVDSRDIRRADDISGETNHGADARIGAAGEADALSKGQQEVTVFIACADAVGAPHMFITKTCVSSEEYADGEHLKKGKSMAAESGFDVREAMCYDMEHTFDPCRVVPQENKDEVISIWRTDDVYHRAKDQGTVIDKAGCRDILHAVDEDSDGAITFEDIDVGIEMYLNSQDCVPKGS